MKNKNKTLLSEQLQNPIKKSGGIKQFYGPKPVLALGDMEEIKNNAHHTIVQIHIKQWMSIIMNKIDFNVLQSKIHL